MDKPARAWLGLGAVAAALFLLCAVLVLRLSAVTRWEQRALAAVTALRRPRLDPVVDVITDLGSYLPVTAVMVALASMLGLWSRRLLEPVVLVTAVEASESLVMVVKDLTERARPPVAGMLGAPVVDYSFPSGHTASGTVLYLLGALLLAHAGPSGQTGRAGWRVLVAAGAGLGLLIGLSRVYLGFHWLGDVTGGWLLALALTGAAMAIVVAYREPDPTILLVSTRNNYPLRDVVEMNTGLRQ